MFYLDNLWQNKQLAGRLVLSVLEPFIVLGLVPNPPRGM